MQQRWSVISTKSLTKYHKYFLFQWVKNSLSSKKMTPGSSILGKAFWFLVYFCEALLFLILQLAALASAAILEAARNFCLLAFHRISCVDTCCECSHFENEDKMNEMLPFNLHYAMLWLSLHLPTQLLLWNVVRQRIIRCFGCQSSKFWKWHCLTKSSPRIKMPYPKLS